MFIYLASAIDRNKKDDTKAVEDAIKDSGQQIVLFRPAKAFLVVDIGESEKNLISVNEHALFISDVVIAVYSPGVESWGMPYELFYAQMHNIPVYLVSDETYNLFPIYLRYLVRRENCFTFNTLDKMLIKISNQRRLC